MLSALGFAEAEPSLPPAKAYSRRCNATLCDQIKACLAASVLPAPAWAVGYSPTARLLPLKMTLWRYSCLKPGRQTDERGEATATTDRNGNADRAQFAYAFLSRGRRHLFLPAQRPQLPTWKRQCAGGAKSSSAISPRPAIAFWVLKSRHHRGHKTQRA